MCKNIHSPPWVISSAQQGRKDHIHNSWLGHKHHLSNGLFKTWNSKRSIVLTIWATTLQEMINTVYYCISEREREASGIFNCHSLDKLLVLAHGIQFLDESVNYSRWFSRISIRRKCIVHSLNSSYRIHTCIRQQHSLHTKKACKLLLHVIHFENNNTSGIMYTE